MKRIIGLLLFIAMLAAPSLALAWEQTGIYVAPKFVYGYALIQGQKADADNGETWDKGNDGDSVFGGALAVGYDFNKKFQVPLRAELEYAAFSKAEGKSSQTWYYDGNDYFKDSITQKLGLQTLFLNVYYDFRNSTAFTPYLGAGLGLAFLRAKGQEDWMSYDYGDSYSGTNNFGAKTSTNFAWNIGAGLAYDFTDYFSLDLNYRFAGLGKAKTADGPDGNRRIKTDNVYMHQVLLAFRFTF